MEICGSRASTSESKGSCPQDAGQKVLWHTSSTRSRNEFIRCNMMKLLFTMASDDHFSFGLANLSLLLVASEKLYLRNFGIVKWVGVWYLPQLVIKEYQLSRLPLNLHPPEPRNLADLIFLLRSSQGWWRSTLLKLSWAAFLSAISILRNVDPGWRMVDLCLTSIPESIPWEGKSCFAVFLGWRYFSHHQQEKSLPLIPSQPRGHLGWHLALAWHLSGCPSDVDWENWGEVWKTAPQTSSICHPVKTALGLCSSAGVLAAKYLQFVFMLIFFSSLLVSIWPFKLFPSL